MSPNSGSAHAVKTPRRARGYYRGPGPSRSPEGFQKLTGGANHRNTSTTGIRPGRGARIPPWFPVADGTGEYLNWPSGSWRGFGARDSLAGNSGVQPKGTKAARRELRPPGWGSYSASLLEWAFLMPDCELIHKSLAWIIPALLFSCPHHSRYPWRKLHIKNSMQSTRPAVP